MLLVHLTWRLLGQMLRVGECWLLHRQSGVVLGLGILRRARKMFYG
jgi:hypothetical protein